MTQLNQQLQIIAQPKAHYRDRYASELNEHGAHLQRYMCAEKNQFKLKYPTVQARNSISSSLFVLNSNVICF